MTVLVRAWDALVSALLAGAGLVIAAVTLLIAWDVVARNLGLQPPESTVALTEYALLYVALASGPALVRSRGHVTIDLLAGHLPAGLRPWLARGMLATAAATAAAVAVLAVLLALEALERGELDVRSFDIPRIWLFAPLAVGGAMMAVEFLRLLARGEVAARPPAERESL
ncbi:MAG: TRAP transporter small permease subunit [Chromatiales bacterium]|nr:TRAP transporter small permease subunit [Chromatiales bacterium]